MPAATSSRSRLARAPMAAGNLELLCCDCERKAALSDDCSLLGPVCCLCLETTTLYELPAPPYSTTPFPSSFTFISDRCENYDQSLRPLTCDHLSIHPFPFLSRPCLPRQPRRSPWSTTARSRLRPSSCCPLSTTTTAQHPPPPRTSASSAYYWVRMMERSLGYQTASQVRTNTPPPTSGVVKQHNRTY